MFYPIATKHAPGRSGRAQPDRNPCGGGWNEVVKNAWLTRRTAVCILTGAFPAEKAPGHRRSRCFCLQCNTGAVDSGGGLHAGTAVSLRAPAGLSASLHLPKTELSVLELAVQPSSMQSLQYQCFSSQLLVCDSFRALTSCQKSCPRAVAAAKAQQVQQLLPGSTAAPTEAASVSAGDAKPVIPLHV